MDIQILVVDDDEDLIFLAQQFLGMQDEDFHLVPATTGQEALRLLESNEIDAVICDYYLGPGQLNGLEILEWLRDQDSDIPFIIFTGRSREDIAIQALNLGADYYFEKTDDLGGLFSEIAHHVKSVVRHRRMKEVLDESEERYRSLVQSIDDILLVLDENNFIVQYHPSENDVFVTNPASIRGTHIMNILPSTMAESSTRLAEEVRDTGERRSTDYGIVINGDKMWFTANFDLHENGKYVVITLIDTTKRKKVEENLRQAEAEWRHTFDAIPDMVSVIDTNFRIMKANESTYECLGLSREEIIGEKCYEVFHDSSAPIPECPHTETAETGEDAVAEISDFRNGCPFLVTTSPLFDHDGNQIGVVHIAKDISERVQIREALQASEAKFRAIFERAGIGMSMVTLDGHFLEANRALQDILGYSREELLSMQTADITHPDDIAKDEAALSSMLKGDLDRYQIEKRYIRKDGTILWGLLTVSLLRGENGSPIGTVGMLENITQRKQAEKLLREEKERAQMYLDQAGTVILVTDLNLDITLLNKKGSEVLGYNEEDVLGKNWIEMFIPDGEKESIRGYMSGILAGTLEPTKAEEGPVLTSTGEIRWIEWSDAVLKDENGKPTGILSAGPDITERKKAKEEARQSYEKFRQLFEQAPIGTAQVDLEGNIFEVNPALSDMLGYSRKELVSMQVQDVTHPDDWGTEAELNQEMLSGERNSYSARKRFIDRNGNVIWGDLHVSVNRNEDGAPRSVVGMVSDVTDEVLAKRELTESEEQFRMMAENISDGLMILQEDSLVYANDRVTEILGFTQEELSNMSYSELVADEEKDRLLKSIQKCEAEKRGTQTMSLWIKRKNGSRRYVNGRYTCFEKDDGHLMKYILLTDRTDEKLAQEKLKRKEKRFREFYEKAPFGCQMLDEQGCLLDVNQKWLETMGYSRQEVLGVYFGEFLTEEGKQRFSRVFAEFKERGFVEDIKYNLIKRDGSVLKAVFNGQVIYDEAGNFVRTQCIFRDITTVSKTNAIRERQQEELEDLAHMMVHNLASKMRNISNLVDLLKTEHSDSTIRKLDSIAHHSAELLCEAAELAEEPAVATRKEWVDLRELARTAAATTIPNEIETDIDDLPRVLANRKKAATIFENIFRNAVEHGQPNRIEVRKEKSNQGTSIIISNDGVPIPQHIRDKIFRRGFTTKDEGAGMGLAVVEKVVKAHGWRIYLEPSDTTTFRIALGHLGPLA